MVKLDEFVTIKEAARILGVSLNTLRNWHRDGQMTVYRNLISGYRLFRKTDLEELLRQIEESGNIRPVGTANTANQDAALIRATRAPRTHPDWSSFHP